MRNNYKWSVTSVALVLTIILSSCTDDESKYSSDIDLNQIHLTQAFNLWKGSECNIFTDLKQTDEEAKNITYDLSISMYQKRKAPTNTTVKLIVDSDTLNKAITLSSDGGLYEKYADVMQLPSTFYQFSATSLTLNAGSQESIVEALTIKSEAIIQYIQTEKKVSTKFVLPVRITNPTTCRLNQNTHTLMYFFNVDYVAPTEPTEPTEPDFEPDIEGVPDDHQFEGKRLVWHDEFNGVGAPNPDMWRFETGFVRNEEDQWYQSHNALMQDGVLLITGRKEQVKNPNYQAGSSDWKKNREYAAYTSSCIVVKDPYVFKYGTMLVRAKIPTTPGSWPAIWSVGNWWEWPLNGEIDMMEFYKEKIHANVCWGSDWRWVGTWNSANKPKNYFIDKDAAWSDKYHIWRMDWDSKYIRIYLDGELLNETNLALTVNKGDNGAGEGGYQNPYSNDYAGFGQRMMLNLAIGGINGRPIDESAFPLEYKVDYIRIYQ